MTNNDTENDNNSFFYSKDNESVRLFWNKDDKKWQYSNGRELSRSDIIDHINEEISKIQKR